TRYHSIPKRKQTIFIIKITIKMNTLLIDKKRLKLLKYSLSLFKTNIMIKNNQLLHYMIE
ncbi:hypothetical protein C9J45_21050, partial [Photobacterium sp. GB-1]